MLANSFNNLLSLISIFSIKVFGAVSSVLVSLVITRNLSSEQAGAYFFAFSSLMILGVLSRLGTGQAALKFIAMRIANDNYNIWDIVYKCLMISSFGSSVGVLIFFIINKLYPALFPVFAYSAMDQILFCLAVVSYGYQSIFSQTLRAIGRTNTGLIFDNILPLMIFVLAMLYMEISEWDISLSISVNVLFVSYIISSFFAFLMVAAFLFNRVSDAGESLVDVGVGFKKIIYFGIVVYATNVVNVLFNESTIIMASAILPQNEVAIFGVSFRLSKSALLSLLIANVFLEPKIGRFIKLKDNKGLEFLVRMATTVGAVLTIGLFVVIIVWGKFLLTSWFGKIYSDSYNLLVIFMVGYLVNALTGPASALLIMGNKQKYAMYINVFMLIIYAVFLCFFLQFKGYGIALSFSIAMSISNIIMMVVCYMLVKVKTFPVFIPAKVVDMYR